MPSFSKRSNLGIPNSISMEESKAKNLIRLSDSNPTHFGLGIGKFGTYNPDPKGSILTRTELSRFLNSRRKPISKNFLPSSSERLYLTNSTSQAYGWLMKLLCDPGEKIAYPLPGYPLIPSIARFEGVEAVPYLLEFDGSWYINLYSFKEALEEDGVKAAVLIHPNNPTGSYVKEVEFEEICRMCESKGMPLICDEVFYPYAFSERIPGRISGNSSNLTFSLDGFSKILASPQLKTAWVEVSGPKEEVEEAVLRLDAIADDFLPNSWFQNASMPELLRMVPQKTEEVRKRCSANLGTLQKAFQRKGLASSLILPEGGWNALIRFPSSVSEDDLVLDLMRNFRYSIQPGYFFDVPFNCLSISLLLSKDMTECAIKVITNAIEERVCK